MSRVLILTASFGEGHNAAARNLREALQAANPSIEVRVSDIFLETYGWINRVMQKTYLKVINHAPIIWQIIFALIERPGLLESHMPIYRKAARRLEGMLRENPVDVVVSTYPGCNHLLDLIFREKPRPFRMVTVITDSLTINSAWLRAHSDYYVVANEPSADVLRTKGVPDSKVKVLGFPVPRIFATLAGRRENEPAGGKWSVLYVVNSAHHLAPAVVRELMKIENIRLAVTYGKDEVLHEALKVLIGDADVALYGWTPEMPQLMAASHLMISKAGGATVQESLAARTPMIVTQVVPGQEEGNARLVIESGAGAFARTPAGIARAVREAFAGEAGKWLAWHASAEKLGRPDASDQIACFLLETEKTVLR